MDRRAHWQTVYTTKAETEVSWFQDRPETSLRLIGQWAAPGAQVLDVGGGASRLVDHLIAAGYAVTVLDVAEAALATARARLGDAAGAADWVVADVTRWQPDRMADLWHDRAVFHFLTEEEDRRAYAARMARAVPEKMDFAGSFASRRRLNRISRNRGA